MQGWVGTAGDEAPIISTLTLRSRYFVRPYRGSQFVHDLALHKADGEVGSLWVLVLVMSFDWALTIGRGCPDLNDLMSLNFGCIHDDL